MRNFCFWGCAFRTTPKLHLGSAKTITAKVTKDFFVFLRVLVVQALALLTGAGWFAQAGIAGQLGCFVGCFPGEISVVASEVAVGRGLLVDRTSQVRATR